MEITLTFKWYPGYGDRPRPALKVTARAQRRDAKGRLEEFIHTRTVDAEVPESWIDGLDDGLATMLELRTLTRERAHLKELGDAA
jgi:hypothetical protein